MDQYILEVKHDRIAIYGKVPLCQLAAVHELARSYGFTELKECRDGRMVWFEFGEPEVTPMWRTPPLESSFTSYQFNQFMEDTK